MSIQNKAPALDKTPYISAKKNAICPPKCPIDLLYYSQPIQNSAPAKKPYLPAKKSYVSAKMPNRLAVILRMTAYILATKPCSSAKKTLYVRKKKMPNIFAILFAFYGGRF